MDKFVEVLAQFANRVEMETGKKLKRIEIGEPEVCMRVRGIEVICSGSFAGRLYLHYQPFFKYTWPEEKK